jgi:hypothetical protein
LERKALSDNEKVLLTNAIEEEKSDFPKRTLFLIAFFILFIFVPDRYKHRSIYSEYGFYEPAVILGLLATGYSYFLNRSRLTDLAKDVDCEEKIREAKVVWRKEKSFRSGKLIIRLDSNIKEFKTFDISHEEYDRIEKGHIVFLEYAENSKVLFKMDLNLE